MNLNEREKDNERETESVVAAASREHSRMMDNSNKWATGPTVSHEIISAINHNQVIEMYFQHRRGADPADLTLCFPPTVLIALKQ